MSVPFEGPLSAALGRLDYYGKIKTETRSFQRTELQDFANFIGRSFEDVADRHTEDASLLIIERWDPFFRGALLQKFPGFPTQYLAAVEHPESQGPSLLPSFHASNSFHSSEGFDFSLSHLTATADNRSRTGEAKYLRTSFTISFRTTGRKPVMIFIGNYARPDLIQIVTKHYSSDSARRWKRLLKEPRWGIADCLYLFADWTSTLNTLRDKLREAELRSSENRLPVAVRTRLLHQQTATVVEVRESLRFYQAVIVHTRDKQNGHIGQDLADQLRQMKRQLDHNMITLDTLKDQLSNLINLEFNLATVAQSRSVAGLTVLALIYIPLSYVASFFAIPNLNANPKLYPAAALPLLLLTLTAAWITSRVMQREAGQSIPIRGTCLRLMSGAIRLSRQLRQRRGVPDIEGGTSPAPAPAPAPLSPSQAPPAEGKGKEEHESKSGSTSDTTSPVPSPALFSFPPSTAALSEEGEKKDVSLTTTALFANPNPPFSVPTGATSPETHWQAVTASRRPYLARPSAAVSFSS